MANPNRRIQLTVGTQNVYTNNSLFTYRVTVAASNANLMPNEIFLYQLIPAVPSVSAAINRFISVCTPQQLSSVPTNAPNLSDPNLYFRLATIDVSYSTPGQASSALNDIIIAVDKLKEALDYSENLSSTTIWIGNPPP